MFLKLEFIFVLLNFKRWREVMSSSAPGPLLMMQSLVIRMPDVAEVRKSTEKNTFRKVL